MSYLFAFSYCSWGSKGRNIEVVCHSLLQWATFCQMSKKDVLFTIGDWIAEVGSQETPGITDKFDLGVLNEAKQRLIEFCQECTGHNKHSLPTTQEKTLHLDITTCSILKSRFIILFAAKDWKTLYSQRKQDWELTMAQIMNSLLPNSGLKKAGKTTGPFRYDLNQIPNDYRVEVRNRFKRPVW